MSPAFRVPLRVNLLDNNHFYNGPPAAKPSRKKLSRKSRSNPANRPFPDYRWTNIGATVDEIDGTVLGPNAESEAESVLTPAMKGGGETRSEDSARAQHERESEPFGDSGSPGALGAEVGDGNSNRPPSADGSSRENPVVIADGQADTESEDVPTSSGVLFSHGHDLGRTEAAVTQGGMELERNRGGRLDRRKDEPSTDSTWTDIDEIVDGLDGTGLEPNLEPECEGVLTPTMKRAETLGLIYSGDKIDGENTTGSSFEWESNPLKYDNFPEDSGTERGAGNLNRPASAEGSNPVIIDDDQSSIDSEDDQSDTNSEDDLPSLECLTNRRRDLGREGDATRAGNRVVDPSISSAARLDDGRHSPPAIMDVVDADMADAAVTHDATVPEESCGSERDPSVDGTSTSDTEHGDMPGCRDIALESGGEPPSPGPKHSNHADETGFGALPDSQIHSSDYDNRSAAVETVDSALGPEESHRGERDTPDEPLSKHNKRKRPRDADADASGGQTLNTEAPVRSIENPYPASRRSLEITDGSNDFDNSIVDEDRSSNAHAQQQTLHSSSDATAATSASLQQHEPFHPTDMESSNLRRKRRRIVRPSGLETEPKASPEATILRPRPRFRGGTPCFDPDVGESSKPDPWKRNHVIIRPLLSGPLLSSNVAHLTAIIRNPRDIAAFTGTASTAVLQSGLCHAGKLDDISLVPLVSEMWLLTGIIYYSFNNANQSQDDVGKQDYTRQDDDEVSSDDGCSDKDNLNEANMAVNDKSMSDDEKSPSSRKRGRWSREDDERLIQWKKEEKEWKWIFKRFPGRTEASVRSRWNVVLRSRVESS